MGNDQDNLLVLPLTTMQRRVVGHTRVNTLLVSLADDADVARTKAGLSELMRERRKLADNEDDNFSVLDTRQIADAMSGTTQVMTMLLGAVAAVSLVVGGIGIMNMLVIALATAASLGLARMMSVPYQFDPAINALSFVFSAGIGVVFGCFPARRAARMDPIEALRHE